MILINKLNLKIANPASTEDKLVCMFVGGFSFLTLEFIQTGRHSRAPPSGCKNNKYVEQNSIDDYLILI